MDLAKDSIHLSDEIAIGQSKDDLLMMKDMFMQEIGRMKSFDVNFYEGHTMKVLLEDGTLVDEGLYTIVNDSSNDFTKKIDPDNEFSVTMRDGRLHWYFLDDSDDVVELILERKED